MKNDVNSPVSTSFDLRSNADYKDSFFNIVNRISELSICSTFQILDDNFEDSSMPNNLAKQRYKKNGFAFNLTLHFLMNWTRQKQ